MPEVKIKVENVEDLRLATKTTKATDDEPARKLTQISFVADIAPVDVARILQIDRAGHGIDATISSPQAMFDLKMEKVDLKSGELVKV